ncbi:glutaminyl-peptide cyclotransferase [Winogradskyella haliclonae]|uniref:Glutamine cyclotransferase n=1 Tax=Winogradskyella haliclonae TaxID=2048558 RepID=A0ABQ2C0X9_9FLAO|nr:glutaminyl-peptide cyclotransferase [Winogradskyella haliclonae]GGI57871.1 glutamine cyclotransferase [Winogradskyella haliclonae]
MFRFKYLVVTLLGVFLIGCASEKPQLSVKTSAKNNTAKLGETVKLSLNNPDGVSINSINYLLDGETITENLKLNNKLGKQDLIANVISENDTIIAKSNLVVLDRKDPELYAFPDTKNYNKADYTVEIINIYPHDETSYTQGLEFHNGALYESTGQFGESKLRKVDYKTGEVLKNLNLNSGYFAEGLTILDNKIYQLTWKADTGIIYDLNTFEKLGIFRYNESKEGWGLCNDGKTLYKSDGTEKIWSLNTSTLTEDDRIEVYTKKAKVGRLNELEWIDGKIYANLYTTNFIIIINPKNGSIDGIIDMGELTKQIPNYSKDDNVLNGIAYNPDTETIFVTGKRWDKLFEIKITKK